MNQLNDVGSHGEMVMRIQINRDLCTGKLGFCERCLSRLLVYPGVYQRECVSIVDDNQDGVSVELRSGASGALPETNVRIRPPTPARIFE